MCWNCFLSPVHIDRSDSTQLVESSRSRAMNRALQTLTRNPSTTTTTNNVAVRQRNCIIFDAIKSVVERRRRRRRGPGCGWSTLLVGGRHSVDRSQPAATANYSASRAPCDAERPGRNKSHLAQPLIAALATRFTDGDES